MALDSESKFVHINILVVFSSSLFRTDSMSEKSKNKMNTFLVYIRGWIVMQTQGKLLENVKQIRAANEFILDLCLRYLL